MLPANTDFIDSLNVDGLHVENTWVNIGDDCFSPKSNTSNVYINNMYCNGKYTPSVNARYFHGWLAINLEQIHDN